MHVAACTWCHELSYITATAHPMHMKFSHLVIAVLDKYAETLCLSNQCQHSEFVQGK